jgi:hypothetical protein
MKRILIVFVLACLLAIASVGMAAAAPNPSGSGPPSVECGEEGATSGPAGFDMPGFAIAETNYSHSSQYDVACYQQPQNGH